MFGANLNELGVPVDHDKEPQSDNGMSAVAPIDVIFRNHRARLVAEITRFPVVLGCVAWLTDTVILEALAKCRHVSIIVQKEDFLRPDLGQTRAQSLRRLYDALPSPLLRYALPGGVSSLNYAGDPSIAAVRCVGNHNSEKRSAWPRMHNKFLIFCDQKPDGDGLEDVVPRKVWTGSYNISANAAASWENAIMIDSPEVANAYAREYGQIMALSEPLDWRSPWVAPEYRIGS
jgi:hypothetical protein